MISIDFIQRMVAEHYRIPVEAMRLSDRHRDWAWPRQMAMALAVEFTGRRPALIGQSFGGRDQASVRYAARAIDERAGWQRDALQTRAVMRARLECLALRSGDLES